MVLLIYGADFFVIGASAVAKKLKVPSLIIGLTVVAMGTSLPELATSIVAAKKGDMGLSLGNVVGSNIVNIILIFGSVGIFGAIPISNLILMDTLILFVTTAIFLSICYTKSEVSRWEDALMLFIYMGNFAFAIVRNDCLQRALLSFFVLDEFIKSSKKQ